MTWDEAFSQLESVRDELEAARFALSSVQQTLLTGVRIADGHQIKPSHLQICVSNLKWTYSLRLFVEFESVLRNYWQSVRPRSRRAGAEILINRVAVVCLIPFEVLREAHEVRDQRNSIAHGAEPEQQYTFDECKSRLGRFLSYLPVTW